MPHRFKQIQYAIARYSRGDFARKLLPSGKGDVIDAFIESLNMLGEEMRVTTVSKQYFENIFNSAPDIIIILNAKGEIVSANTALKKNRDLPKILPGKIPHFNDFFVIPDKKNAFHFFTRLKKGTNPEARILLKSNSKKVFLCNISLLNKGTQEKQYIAVLRDITELERYQLQLASSERKYREIFNGGSDGILMFSVNGVISEMNATLKNLVQPGTANVNAIKYIHQLIQPVHFKTKELLQKITDGEVIENIEVKILVEGNKMADGLFSCVPVYDELNGTGFQGMIKNISEYKKYNSLLMLSIDKMQEKERKRIAGDLHDSLGQQLIGVKLMMNNYMTRVKNENAKEQLLEINKTITATIEELRSICFDLMPGTLENFGLIAAIEELLIKAKKGAVGCEIHFHIAANFPRLGKELEVALYRMIQEILNNALKYAACTNIHIRLQMIKGNCLFLRFSDNGKGFHTDILKRKKGMGILNISTRVHAFNGSVLLTSEPDKGTVYEIKIPV